MFDETCNEERWLAIAGISAVLVCGAGLWAVNHAAVFILKSLGEQDLEAKKIFLKKLNEEEYDKLIAIASK